MIENSDDDGIILDANSPELYAPGFVVAHSSDDSGIPDVGISVGFDSESMLFAGEIPGCNQWALVLYRRKGERTVISRDMAPDVARDLIEKIARRIRREL